MGSEGSCRRRCANGGARFFRALGIFLLAFPLPLSAAAQKHLPLEAFEEWDREVFHAVEMYIGGDTAGALALLLKRDVPPEQQRDFSRTIFRDLEAGRHTSPQHPPWTLASTRALATLRMEAALGAYHKRDEKSLSLHITLAEEIFAYVAKAEERPDAAPGWELAIGLTAMSEAQSGWALSVLDAACGRFPNDAALLLACGSIHDAIATLPADALTVESAPAGSRLEKDQTSGRIDNILGGAGLISPLMRAGSANTRRMAHVKQLDTAARHLERVLQLDPSNVEARLRLAHVRIIKDRAKDAAPLLEDVISGRVKGDARADYLAALFLGGIEMRVKRLDRAEALFRAASDRLPSAQSAKVALAAALHAQNRVAESAAVVEGVLQSPDEFTDPWWGYRFGQYWAIDPLLGALRAQVRK